MKHVFKRSLILCLLVFVSMTDSRAVDLTFRQYQVENGLSSNTVYTLIQDSKGFIWMGTEDGLNRFDGYEFRIFRNNSREPASIISNHIYKLFEDAEGLLWIGTEKGVCTYDTRTEKISQMHQTTKNGETINGRVQSILEDKTGRIWFSTYEQGVFRLNKKTGSLRHYSFDNFRHSISRNTFVTCLYMDKDGDCWVSANNTKHHLYKLDKKTGRFVPAFPHADPDVLAKLDCYSITEDSFGNLWVGTWENGLFAINKKDGTLIPFLQEYAKKELLHIHTVMEYEPGKLMIGADGGLRYYSIVQAADGRQQLLRIEKGSLSSNFVYTICRDREGGLWIGTYYGGVYYSSPNQHSFKQYVHRPAANSISGNVISTMCEDASGNLWIGTDDAGLNYFNTKTQRFTNIQTGPNRLSFHNIHGLCLDGDDLWIGTYTGGLNVMNTRTGKMRYYVSSVSDKQTLDMNSIYAIFRDSRGTMWVGTMWGINRYNRSTDDFSRVIRTNAVVVDILQKGSLIYFATQGKGLYTFNQQTGVWKHYPFDVTNPSSILSDDVSCLCLDASGRLWVGTNSGICRYEEKTRRFIPVPVSFPSNNISYMTAVGGYLWITTTKGLIRFDPNTLHFRVFTKGDGLLSDQFTLMSGCLTRSGMIYAGTASGMNAFDPARIYNNPYVPQVAITDFQLFNQSVSLSDYLKIDRHGVRTITLPYNKNGFSLVFSALSYFAPEKNEYAYKLEGFDEGWNRVGNQRKVTYTNLSPGTYCFKVKASNNDGLWNDTGLSVNIVLTPPIWRSNLFLVLYVLLLILAVRQLFKVFRKRQEAKQNERIEKMKAEQEKAVYSAKINFFTSIAHEIRTPVSLIMGPIEQLTKPSGNLSESAREDLNIIERNAQRLLFLVNQLLDFRKIERESVQVSLMEANVTDLLRSISERFKPFFSQKNIRFDFVSDDELFHTKVDVENLTKVVSNLLNNASKYSKDLVELALYSQQVAGRFEVRVTDNGAGIPPQEQENIFKPFYQVPGGNKPGTGIGLYLVKTVVDALGGSVKVESIPGNGSVFSVFLPYEEPEAASDASQTAETLEQQPEKEPDTDMTEEATKVVPDDEKPVLLIVEDNVDMQQFLWKNFTTLYTVLLAGDGVEGIKVLEKNEVNLIISDIMMPNMDGIEFCRQIKSSFLWNHLPVILLTAKTNLSTKIEAMETGADAYVEKPFSMTYLAAQVKNLLDSRKALQARFIEKPFVSLKSMAGNKADEEFLLKVTEVIEKNISNVDFSVEQLSEALCVSNSSLYAKIRTLSGITPNKLLLLVRLKKAAELLSSNDYRVNEVCYMVGFNNPSYFAKCFHKQFGVLPKDFRATQQ